MRRWTIALVASVATLASCTDGDDTATTVAQRDGPNTAAAGASAPPGTIATTIAPVATSPGATSPSSTIPSTTLPPPVAVEDLSPGLLGAPAVGVPDDWAMVDVDPAVVDDPALRGDIDPLRGLLVCPDGVLRDDAAPWLARRFSAVEAPMDNGLLTIELILEQESDADHDADVRRLQECDVEPGTSATWFEGRFDDPETPAVTGLAYTGLRLEAEPTDETPFPIAYEAIWAHAGDHSVAAVLGGQPTGSDWPVAARRIAAQALTALGT